MIRGQWHELITPSGNIKWKKNQCQWPSHCLCCTLKCMYIYLCLCVWQALSRRMYAQKDYGCLSPLIQYKQLHKHTQTHIYKQLITHTFNIIHAHTHTYTFTQTHTQGKKHKYKQWNTHKHTYTYTIYFPHTHTHTHTHTDTHTPRMVRHRHPKFVWVSDWLGRSPWIEVTWKESKLCLQMGNKKQRNWGVNNQVVYWVTRKTNGLYAFLPLMHISGVCWGIQSNIIPL